MFFNPMTNPMHPVNMLNPLNPLSPIHNFGPSEPATEPVREVAQQVAMTGGEALNAGMAPGVIVGIPLFLLILLLACFWPRS